MSSFAERIISYYKTLQKPEGLPTGVEILFPFESDEIQDLIAVFYTKYFSDQGKRIQLIGINPGRIGAGQTGIPFTDSYRLREELMIDHDLSIQKEISSEFIYKVIDAFNGPEHFYKHFYFSSVSPVGFVKDGINMNYYDDKDLENSLASYILGEMKKQINEIPTHKHIAFSLGKGKNAKYLSDLNKKNALFGKIVDLPHPRWVMQYQRKKIDHFVDVYVNSLHEAIYQIH